MGYYKRLRELRNDNDLTQSQVGEMLYMKQPQYQRYEKGHRDIPVEVVLKLADIYGTSTDYILGKTDDPLPYSDSKTIKVEKKK